MAKTAKKNILVCYLNVGGILPEDVPAFVEKTKKQLGPIPESCYRYVIPTREEATRLDVLYLNV